VATARVIFDCDGVLVDGAPIANRVFGRMLEEQGLAPAPEAMMERFVGRPMARCLG
jgi:beta-phosphoglucomutase-like phosphatase (HAD superfamily)